MAANGRGAGEFAGMPEVPGVAHSMVDTGEVRLHVATAGAGEPVLLLHGWPQHWWMWRGAIPRLAERYKVYAPDLRGFGWSDAPAHGYLKQRLATDIIALIDALGIDAPIRLAGHDWGAWTGFLIALREPRRFDRFFALNIAPPWGDPRPMTLANWAKTLTKLTYQLPLSTPGVNRWLLSGGGRARTASLIERSSRASGAWAGGAIDTYLGQFDDPRRADATMRLYRSFVTRELPRIAAKRYVRERLTVPTRVLFGADDVAIDARLVAADHSRFADDYAVEIVPHCGHFIVDEQPDLVSERMLAWFAT